MRIQLKCGADGRRLAVEDHPTINGIDYLEVLMKPQSGIIYRPLLLVYCFKEITAFDERNVKIDGGVRIKNIKAEWVQRADVITKFLTTDEQGEINKIDQSKRKNVLVIRPNNDGDFSTYILRLIRSVDNQELPPVDFDVLLSQIDFSFKVECPVEFDCTQQQECPPEVLQEPVIDYMAKDYASFRRLMLDRLAMINPDWKERNTADLGIVLVELLAYVGDQLSYYQDAVATEAYLGTGRSRISVRRHARLLDYSTHDGCNARAWVCIEVNENGNGKELPEKTKLLTGSSNEDIVIDEGDLEKVLSEGAKVFETMHNIKLYSAHNEMHFYAWGDSDCCLPSGATRATLTNTDNALKLKVGDVIIFEEVRSPTGGEDDEDPSHRQAVRLTRVKPTIDELTNTSVIDIEWDQEDALQFPLCICTEKEPEPVSIGRGNVVLADHGYTFSESLTDTSLGRKFRPRLSRKPLTYKGPPFDASSSAASAFNYDVQEAEPDILVDGEDEEGAWKPIRDLLSSDRFACEFVVEMENDGTAQIRFGDGKQGMNPQSNVDKDPPSLSTIYRIGNGREGNVGAESITRIVIPITFNANDITKIRNPMPAQGGRDPEKLDEVRQNSPEAFRTQERAVTESDYTEVLMRHHEVQKAATMIRWTGSWHTVFVTIDRYGGREVDEDFKTGIRNFLNSYRLAGYDVEINAPSFIPLEIQMSVCVDQNHFREEVKEALLEAFSNRDLPDERQGFFHPDNFTFGQSVFLSKIYEAAMKVDGVGSIVITKFRRRGRSDEKELEEGVIKIGSYEIAQLDNDPNYPDKGTIEFIVEGGR